MKWSHIFLFVLAVAASTGRYVLHPFPAGSENPVVALMALDAPMLLWLMHGWYAAMPGVVVFIGGTLVFGCVARMVGTRAQEAGRPRRPSPVADFGNGRETGHRRRRDTSSGRGAGGSQPKVARHPGEGTVYRSRHLRSSRVREDLGVHEPLCPAVTRLASHKSEAPGRRPGPRSEGGFLLRHPEDSRRGGPGRRLHGAQPGRQISVEPPGRALARFLLPGLYGFLSLESVVRQGERPVLAAWPTRIW